MITTFGLLALVALGAGDRPSAYAGAGGEATSARTATMNASDRTTLPVRAGLFAWYDADSFSGNDRDPLMTWSDSSGNGRHLVSEAPYPKLVKNAINGHPAAEFEPKGGLTFFGVSIPAEPQPNTVFVVMKHDAADGITVATDGEPGHVRHAFYIAAHTFRVYAGQTLDSGIRTDTRWHVHTAVFDGGSSRYRVDQRQVVGDAGSQGIELIFLGSQYDGDLRLDGRIAEYLFYRTALTDAQIRDVERYLKAKYHL